jgi:hypothetical protein
MRTPSCFLWEDRVEVMRDESAVSADESSCGSEWDKARPPRAGRAREGCEGQCAVGAERDERDERLRTDERGSARG